jgi:pimeloyl-ACP methyl ester carboxylesterase
MTAIFVHGVPDTDHVWHRVIPRLDRDDVVTVRLPGFGAPLPSGFKETMDEYAAWLVAQIATHGAPVDLVGHDWGALLAIRTASLRPDLIRSWAMGGAPLDAGYVWHQAAQVWQTPDAGERAMERTTPEILAKALAAAGVPSEDAREAGAHFDETMKRAILRLYRSAITVGAAWGPDLARITAPGLILWGANDPYAPPTWGERLAQRTGARCVIFPGCSHWWPLERPAEVANELRRLWSGIAA